MSILFYTKIIYILYIVTDIMLLGKMNYFIVVKLSLVVFSMRCINIINSNAINFVVYIKQAFGMFLMYLITWNAINTYKCFE